MVFDFTEQVTELDILSCEYIAVDISKEEVINKDYTHIDRVLKIFKKCKKHGRSKLIILFAFDDVPEEIYEIREIREWVSGLLKRHPYLFYFISGEMQNFQMLIACLADLKIIKRASLTSSEILKMLLIGQKLPDIYIQLNLKPQLYRKITASIIKYGRKIGDSERNISKVLMNLPVKHDPDIEDLIKRNL
jgi:hypothetical protein